MKRRGLPAEETTRNPQGSNHVNMTMPVKAIFSVLLLAATIGLAQDNPSQLSQDQIRTLIRQTADKDMENDKLQRDYTYTQREEQHKLDGKGEVKSTEVKTSEI